MSKAEKIIKLNDLIFENKSIIQHLKIGHSFNLGGRTFGNYFDSYFLQCAEKKLEELQIEFNKLIND